MFHSCVHVNIIKSTCICTYMYKYVMSMLRCKRTRYESLDVRRRCVRTTSQTSFNAPQTLSCSQLKCHGQQAGGCSTPQYVCVCVQIERMNERAGSIASQRSCNTERRHGDLDNNMHIGALWRQLHSAVHYT